MILKNRNLLNVSCFGDFTKYLKPNIIKEPMLNSLYANPPSLLKPSFISFEKSNKIKLFEGEYLCHNQNKKLIISATNQIFKTNEVIEICQSGQPKKAFSDDTINIKDLTKIFFQKSNTPNNTELNLTINYKQTSINFLMLDQNNLKQIMFEHNITNKKIILDNVTKIIQLPLSDFFNLFLITKKQGDKIFITNIKFIKRTKYDVDNFYHKYVIQNLLYNKI